MRCKECNDTMCSLRTVNAEMECPLTRAMEPDAAVSSETVVPKGLCLSDGRIWQVEEHRPSGRRPYDTREDVTDGVLDALMSAMQKRAQTISGKAVEYAALETKRRY